MYNFEVLNCFNQLLAQMLIKKNNVRKVKSFYFINNTHKNTALIKITDNNALKVSISGTPSLNIFGPNPVFSWNNWAQLLEAHNVVIFRKVGCMVSLSRQDQGFSWEEEEERRGASSSYVFDWVCLLLCPRLQYVVPNNWFSHSGEFVLKNKSVQKYEPKRNTTINANVQTRRREAAKRKSLTEMCWLKMLNILKSIWQKYMRS